MLLKQKNELTSVLSNFYQNPIAQVSIELFLSIGLVLFFAMVAIRPTLLTMSDLIKEIDDKKALSSQLDQKLASLSSAQMEYAKLRNRVQVLDVAIPTTPGIIKNLKIFEKIASDQKIVITTINLSALPAETDGKLDMKNLNKKELIFNIGLNGDFMMIKQYVDSLIASRRLFVVDRIVFSVDDNRGVKKLNATIGVKAPYYQN